VSFRLPKPKQVHGEEVVLSRADWDRIVAVLEEPATAAALSEDADDIAAVMAARADDRGFDAHIETQRGSSMETTIPLGVIKAKLDGAHPVRAWRDYRGWTQICLEAESGVGRDLIAQIETRRKLGGVETLDRLAKALNVPMEALLERDGR